MINPTPVAFAWTQGERAGSAEECQPAAISERISARNSSINRRPFLVSMCQKVQPLQAPDPCATAPMRWIEPTLSPSMMAPSARTRAPWRFLESFGERDARRVARGHEWRQRRFRKRFDGGDAGFRRTRIGLVAFEPDVAAAETFCHRAGRAGAVERINHEIAWSG